MKLFAFFFLTLLLSPSLLMAEVLLKEDFEKGISDRWVERGFPSIRNKTRYELFVEENGNRCIRAISNNSYSGKGIFISFNAKKYPILEWRWKIENIIEKGDARKKEGDDHAAKIYVIFPGRSSWNPLDKRLLIYFWASRVPRGEIIPNAFEPEIARMIAIQSGREHVGEWKTENVNIYEDYKRAFGEEPAEVEEIAFVVDTDNTGESVVSYFDDLVIRTAE